jgi:hypothetical protein
VLIWFNEPTSVLLLFPIGQTVMRLLSQKNNKRKQKTLSMEPPQDWTCVASSRRNVFPLIALRDVMLTAFHPEGDSGVREKQRLKADLGIL